MHILINVTLWIILIFFALSAVREAFALFRTTPQQLFHDWRDERRQKAATKSRIAGTDGSEPPTPIRSVRSGLCFTCGAAPCRTNCPSHTRWI